MKLFGLTWSVFLCLGIFISILNRGFCAEPSYLDQLSIIATRSEQSVLETAGSDAVINEDDLRRSGSITLGEALKYEPGVSVPFDFTGADPLVPYLASGEKSINIRGMEGNRIQISVDGIRQPQEFFTAGGMAGAGRVYFDPATLSQIELFKSASSSLYGSEAMGGSINGRTVSPEQLLGKSVQGRKVRNTVSYSSVNQSFSNRLAAAYGNGKYAHSIVYSLRKGQERENSSATPSDPQDSTGHAGVYKSLYQTDSIKWTGTVDLFQQNTFTEVNSVEVGNNRAITHDSDRTRERFSLKFESISDLDFLLLDEFSGQTYWQVSQQQSVNFQDRLDTNVLRRRDISFQTGIVGFDLMAEKHFQLDSSRHLFLYGIEFSQSDVDSKYLKTDLLQNGEILVDNRKSMAPSESQSLGFYLMDEISFGDQEQWVLSPSLRFDYFEIKPRSNESFLANSATVGFTPAHYKNDAMGSPGLSIIYKWNEEINLYLSYNHGVRNPSAEELNGFFEHPPTTSTTSSFIIDANPKLKEETADTFEIGTQAKFETSVLTFAAYQNFYEGFIDLIKQPSPGVVDLYSNDNLGSVEVYGLEFSWDSMDIQILDVLPPVQLGFSTAWSEGMQTDKKVPLNSIEPWKTVGYFGYLAADDSWGIRLYGTYRAPKRSGEIDQNFGEPFPIDGSLVFDLTGWRKINEHWEFNGGLNNFTNEKYFLWSSARRGGGHSGSAVDERNRQPGVNGFLSLTAEF